MASRFARGLGKALTRCAFLLVALTAIVYFYDYAMQAKMRVSEAPNCKWNLVPGTLETPYVARFCYLTRDRVLLRIHDSQGQRLLAERTYLNLGLGRFYWTSDELNYDTSTGESISLPPSRLDGWRARLP